MSLKIAHLRTHAIQQSLFEPTNLTAAIARMGFVQADPIRSPARAQDLILRHRVRGYRVGDLERFYPTLDLDEDVLYAYGFVPPATKQLLHPRASEPSDGLARHVLDFVRRAGTTHPRQLAREVGEQREGNAWGGQSRATTRALEMLHYSGLLRVVRRVAGIRIYEPARQLAHESPEQSLTPDERLRRLALILIGMFAPVPEASLRAMLSQLRHAAPGLEGRLTVVPHLLRDGELERGEIDGLQYIWPASAAPDRAAEVPRAVRFLAPFDPLVWDRRRFEHLWGWPYRFEAYTPASRRRFGYYALPLLWTDRVIGWANLAVRNAQLHVSLGFVAGRPRSRAFAQALEREISRVREFLALGRDRGLAIGAIG